jgi:hypothetical protein
MNVSKKVKVLDKDGNVDLSGYDVQGLVSLLDRVNKRLEEIAVDRRQKEYEEIAGE